MSTNTLGRYHIIREIARSNDIVYEAMDPAQGKRIALKELQLPPNLVGQAKVERIQRFTREARAAARLQHANIVRIHDHGQVQNRHYIAMEFLEGQSLRDVLRQRGVLPLQEALRIAAAAADGLEFAHRNGVVHRDVKPDNVHLEPDGRVVITDFGIARLTFEPTLTADGQIFGTPSYMSPEQVAGKTIDARSDVFSLGVMLYEMVSGRKPFTGDSVITITYNIMNMEPPPLTGAPAGVEQIVRRALNKDPERRYRTIGEMAEDLRAVAGGHPPRHACAPLPAASLSAAPPRPQPSPPRPAPGRSPLPVPPPAGGGRSPLPQPNFGHGGPPRGPVPGARPMPSSAPMPHPGGVRPPGVGVPPPPVPAAPLPPVYQRRNRRSSSGSNALWLLGWLGVALVIGGMILAIVWASVTAYDRFRQERGAVAARQSTSAADRAFGERRYEEALQVYLQAANNLRGEEQRTARKNAAVSASELAGQRLAESRVEDAERLARRALQLNPALPSACVVLGRSLVLQGKVEEGLAAFDQAVETARRLESEGAPELELKAARAAAAGVPEWKAKALLDNGLALRGTNPELAKQRFAAAVRAAPGTAYAQNAQNELDRLAAAESSAPATVPAAASAGDPGSTPSQPPLQDPGEPQRPPGWEPIPDFRGG